MKSKKSESPAETTTSVSLFVADKGTLRTVAAATGVMPAVVLRRALQAYIANDPRLVAVVQAAQAVENTTKLDTVETKNDKVSATVKAAVAPVTAAKIVKSPRLPGWATATAPNPLLIEKPARPEPVRPQTADEIFKAAGMDVAVPWKTEAETAQNEAVGLAIPDPPLDMKSYDALLAEFGT